MREKLGSDLYWNKWVEYRIQDIESMQESLMQPSGNPGFRPQYLFDLAKKYLELMICRYSRGDDVGELSVYFAPLLNAWEESISAGDNIFTDEQKFTRKDWSANLDHYIVCFWLVGFAVIFDIQDDLWGRLIILVDNEAKDILLDRLIATRKKDRKIGAKLCHPKPYERLLTAIDAPREKQAALLLDFVEHWYPDLDRESAGNVPAIYRRPYWYGFGSRNFEGGAFFGRWCIEAAAVAKAFGLDDSDCLGHENYPGDLLRPNGPTTHPVTQKSQLEIKPSWFKRLFRS